MENKGVTVLIPASPNGDHSAVHYPEGTHWVIDPDHCSVRLRVCNAEKKTIAEFREWLGAQVGEAPTRSGTPS